MHGLDQVHLIQLVGFLVKVAARRVTQTERGPEHILRSQLQTETIPIQSPERNLTTQIARGIWQQGPLLMIILLKTQGNQLPRSFPERLQRCQPIAIHGAVFVQHSETYPPTNPVTASENSNGD